MSKSKDVSYGKLFRKRDECNLFCPVCDKPLEALKDRFVDERGMVPLNGDWIFINIGWDVEFIIHPKCKSYINDKTIFPLLKKLGIPYQDHLLGIAFDNK